MKFRLGAIAVAVAAMLSSNAFGWGEPGHQVVGAIAYGLLTPNAKSHVDQLLGTYSLSVATTWADCARDVKKSGNQFVYQANARMTPKVCQTFQTPAEEAAMQDYASRNWTQCVYTKTEGCLGAYHFADIAYQRGDYVAGVTGWSTLDVVHAINAAITVLKCPAGQTCPVGKFSIKDQREALLLLAHFVGDLHQPLHVGAIYLDAQGAVQDPDQPPHNPKALATRGGNSITDGASKQLHGEWDDIATTNVTPALIAQAGKIGPAKGDVSTWAAQWAKTSVQMAGNDVFKGLTFGPQDAMGHWPVSFAQRPDYQKTRAADQRAQLIAGGAHLAQALNAIWP